MASALEALGRYDEAFAIVRRGLSFPPLEKTLEGAQLMLIGAGLYHRRGQIEEAEAWAERSSAIATSHEGEEATRIHARALYLRAILASLRGETDRAIELGLQSLEHYRRLQDLMGEMNALSNLCLVNLNRGAWNEAIKQGESALRIAQRINHIEGRARILTNLGELYRYQGRYDQAREAYTSALELVKQRGMVYGEALMENNLAALALAEGQTDEAEVHLNRAIELFEKIQAERMFAELYRHKAGLHRQRGEWHEACTWARRALDQAQRLKSQSEIGLSHLNLAETALAAGDLDEARHQSEAAEHWLSSAGDSYGLACTWLCAARIAWLQGDRDRAQVLLHQAQAYFDRLGAQKQTAEVQTMLDRLSETPTKV